MWPIYRAFLHAGSPYCIYENHDTMFFYIEIKYTFPFAATIKMGDICWAVNKHQFYTYSVCSQALFKASYKN